MIRRAGLKDIDGILILLDQIADLHRAGRPDIFKNEGKKYNKDDIEKILENNMHAVFVAIDNSIENINIINGYCFTQFKKPSHPVLKDITTLHIGDFCVDENLRGTGIGKMLFGAVLDFAKEQNVYNIDLNVWAFNENAVKFYEKLGFTFQKHTMEMIM